MIALRWPPTLNLQARAALTTLRVRSYAARQRFYSQPAHDDNCDDQPLFERGQKRGGTRYLNPSREFRGRHGIKFKQSSSPLATNTLGKQADVLILSDSGKPDQKPVASFDGPGSLENAAADERPDSLSRLETSNISTDHDASEAGPNETGIDSKSILDTLANEEGNAQSDVMVAKQIESIRPQGFQELDHPVVSKSAFKRIAKSLSRSFTAQQLKTYHNNYLKALRTTLKTSDNSGEFWGEKWDPMTANTNSKHPSGQDPHKYHKSKVIKSIIRLLWKVEIKTEIVEVGSVNGCISEFNFSLLSSGVPPKLEEIAKMRGVSIHAKPKLKSIEKKKGKKDSQSNAIALKHARFTPNGPSSGSKDGEAASEADSVGPVQSEIQQDEKSKESQKLADQSSSDWYISITGPKEPSIQAARDIHEITKRTANLHVRLPRTLDDSLTALRYKKQKLTLPASRRNVVPRWSTEALSQVAQRTGTVIRLSFNGKNRLDSKLENKRVTAIISSGHGNSDRLDDAKRILLTFARFPYPHGARNVLLDPEFSGKTAFSQYVPAPKHDFPIAMQDYRFSPLSRWSIVTSQSTFNTSLFKTEDFTTVENSRIEQLRDLITAPQPKLTLERKKSPWSQQLSHSVMASFGMLLSPSSKMFAPVELGEATKSEADNESATQVASPTELDEATKPLENAEEVFFWPIVPNIIPILNTERSTDMVNTVETLRIRMVPHDAMKRLQPTTSEDDSGDKKKHRVAGKEHDTKEVGSSQIGPNITEMVAPDIYLDFQVDEGSSGERNVAFLGLFAIVKEGSDEIRYPSMELDLQLRNTVLATLTPDRMDKKGQEDLLGLRKHVEDFILDKGPLKPPSLVLSFPPQFPLATKKAGKPWGADGLMSSSPTPGTLCQLPVEKQAKYSFASAERRQTVAFEYRGQPASVTNVSSDVHGDWQDLALHLPSPSPSPPSPAAVDGLARATLTLLDTAGVVERRSRVQRDTGAFETVEMAWREEYEEAERKAPGEGGGVEVDLEGGEGGMLEHRPDWEGDGMGEEESRWAEDSR